MVRLSSLYVDPNHWRARAKESRAMADLMTMTETKTIMLQVARDYDMLAELVEIRRAGHSKNSK